MTDDEDVFFVIILPVTIVIFVSIFTYLFIGYVRLKKHLLNSGQVISALPFLILPEEQPEIRSPDGQLPPPAYNTIVETESEHCNNINNHNNNNNNNNNSGVVNFNHPSLSSFTLNSGRQQRHRNCNRNNRQAVNPTILPSSTRRLSQGELQQSGPPSTEIMLERPPPLYSIEVAVEVPPRANGRTGRRVRKQSRVEHISMNDIAPPPYSPATEVTAN